MCVFIAVGMSHGLCPVMFCHGDCNIMISNLGSIIDEECFPQLQALSLILVVKKLTNTEPSGLCD